MKTFGQIGDELWGLIDANEEAGMAEMASTYAAFEQLGLSEEVGWAALAASIEDENRVIREKGKR